MSMSVRITCLLARAWSLSFVAALLTAPVTAQDTNWASVNGGSGNFGESFDPDISADGRYIVYQSVGNDDPADGCVDILLYDSLLGTTTSLTGCNSQDPPAGQSSQHPSITDDGTGVVYERAAWSGIPTDPITAQIVFDDLSGGSGVVSTNAGGTWANSACNFADVSEDGRYVVFESLATNLTAETTSSVSQDIFVKDRLTGAIAMMSVADGGGAGGNSSSNKPSISANGRHVAFQSQASNLLPAGVDTNGMIDVFVRDRDPDGNGIHDEGNGVTKRVSVDSSGVQGNVHSSVPSISASGRWIAFQSTATNLIPSDTNGSPEAFVHDRDPDGNGIYDEGNGTTETVSKNSAGDQANATCTSPVISGDGNRVAFATNATNLSPLATVWSHIYVHDRTTGQTTMVDIDDDGRPGDFHAGVHGWGPIEIDEDGSRVALCSRANNFDAADTNTLYDIYSHDVCPDTSTDLGFAKAPTGGLVPDYTVCGVTSGGSSVEFRMLQGTPSSFCGIFWGLANAPLPAFGGLIVPSPPMLLSPLFMTDAEGMLSLPLVVPPVPAAIDIYVQWVIEETPGLNYGISNARKLPFVP